MPGRKKLSKRTRFEVFKRDQFTCIYCGQRPPDVVLHCDHLIALADGGSDDLVNLVTSCQDCNLGKSSVPLTVIPLSQSDELDRRVEAAEQFEAMNQFLLEQRHRVEEASHRLAVYWCDQTLSPRESRSRGKWMVSEHRQRNLRTFLSKLPESEVKQAIDLAFGRIPVTSRRDDDSQTWRYFCGICWRRIKGD